MPIIPSHVGRTARRFLGLEAGLMWVRRSFENHAEIRSAADDCWPSPLHLRGGLRVHHEAEDHVGHIFREIFVRDVYLHGAFYEPLPGDRVLDIGANIGLFALRCQDIAPGVLVHCFEPASAARSRLERNVLDNGLSLFVTIHPVAVSGGHGTAELATNWSSTNQALLAVDSAPDAHVETETVTCIPLAEALRLAGDGPVDLLKMDIEGSEIEVVDGATVEDWERIRRVAIEYHDAERPGCADHLVEVLTANSFEQIEVLPDEEDPGHGILRASRPSAA